MFQQITFTAKTIRPCAICVKHGKSGIGHRPGPQCPIIQNFKCGHCGEKGHTGKHCKKLTNSMQYRSNCNSKIQLNYAVQNVPVLKNATPVKHPVNKFEMPEKNTNKPVIKHEPPKLIGAWKTHTIANSLQQESKPQESKPQLHDIVLPTPKKPATIPPKLGELYPQNALIEKKFRERNIPLWSDDMDNY